MDGKVGGVQGAPLAAAVTAAMPTSLGGAPLQFEKVEAEYHGYFATLKPIITELFPIVQAGLRAKKKFLLEQAMGTCLDTDWGTYPFVTASTTLASAATAGNWFESL